MFYLFAGIIAGLFIVSVFRPVKHIEKQTPVPGETKKYKTDTGCVIVKSEEVECSNKGISLNVLIGK